MSKQNSALVVYLWIQVQETIKKNKLRQ